MAGDPRPRSSLRHIADPVRLPPRAHAVAAEGVNHCRLARVGDPDDHKEEHAVGAWEEPALKELLRHEVADPAAL